MPRFKILGLILFFTSVISSVLAQTDCPAIVQAALEAVDSACSATARNQACYGNVQLEATPREGISAFQFEQSGDIVNVASVESLQLSSMSLTDETWGVALMALQANLPDTLPGQNVTFLLFGDVQIDNQTDAPPEITMTATGNVNVRLRPTTNENNVVDSLAQGEQVMATGHLTDSTWIRIKIEGEASAGWVSADFLEGDLSALPEIEPDAPETPEFGPMQSFYFKTGVGDRPCEEAPDSGILIQTPKGAGRVLFTANGVEVALSSTVYLQADAGYMTVSVVEGKAVLTAFNVSQLVPAGSSARVPLDANGGASGPPEIPQPYVNQDLQALPVGVGLPEAVQIAPALTVAEIAATLEAAQPPAEAGQWTWTWTVDAGRTTCANTVGAEFPVQLTFHPDGFLSSSWPPATVWTRTDENTYTYTVQATSPSGVTGTLTVVATFTSPTTAVGEWLQDQSNGCQAVRTLSGVQQ
jgi:hypothetical protein